MTRYVDKAEPEQHDNAIGVWDSEGGASGRAPGVEQYGLRIEAYRSGTIYHVFTGVPARQDRQEMIRLSRSLAIDGMLSLSRRNEVGRRAASNLLPDIRTRANARPECLR